ncbi:Arginine--tRNA ligase [Babesia sp. Xinjiang]|uniref:Arginine--tRNA ligase n=1 Tax=Babesia sp. Xinjiang TaxID=462227 RepID=UPI000A24D088|nr:Arginine--tRNA ligase [Babesia sp. Xinjiang]ORM40611.1 Arginine--tRNA ligase [Babesia sp. Xinjiang]
MPKSKRAKEVRLTSVKKKSKERKLHLVDAIRETLGSADLGNECFVYIISLSNQRNSPLKNLRIILKPGRLFYGKNKVMQLALGAKPETELLPDLHKVAEQLVGERALLVTSEAPDVVRTKLEGYKVVDFAKAGHIASDTVVLKPDDGSLEVFPGNMEPQFRQLGLPTTLNMGKIQLLGEYIVCERDRPLTPTQARVLKVLGIRMALFEANIHGYWTDDFKRGFTTLETIVKRGIERLCDAQSNDVISHCKRPLVRLAGDSCEGDLHTKIAHTLSEHLQIPAEEVAIRLRDEIRKETDCVSDCFVTGNNYINIVLKDEYLTRTLKAMANDTCKRLNVPIMSRQNVVVDYFGPNVGKELHMGHLRSAAIGGAISNILEFCGDKVYRRSHIGDFGAHSGQIIRYLIEYDPYSLDCFTESWTDRERLLELTRQELGYSVWDAKGIKTSNRLSRPTPAESTDLIVNTIGEIYRRAKRQCELDEKFNVRCKEETALLQHGRHLYQKTWENISLKSMQSYRDLLEDFKLDKIRDVPESCYAKRVFKLIDRLVKEGHALKNKDGSITIKIEHHGSSVDPSRANIDQDKEPAHGKNQTTLVYLYNMASDLVLLTREGAATYLSVDLCALEYRLREHKADTILYVTDSAQRGHFSKLITVARQVGILKDQRVEHLGFGAVLAEDGKKLRSRRKSGAHVLDIWSDTFDKCLHEVENKGEYKFPDNAIMANTLAVGSMLYADLSTTHGDTYTFSTDRLLKQGGNNLISILYSYVRGRSILRKVVSDNISVLNDDFGEGWLFRSDFDRNLAVQLVGLENAILTAAIMRAPHRLCKYVWKLSRDFAHFYESTRVLDNGTARAENVLLVDLFAKVTNLVLTLLNIETVDYL